MKLAIVAAMVAAATAQDLNASAWAFKDQMDLTLPQMEAQIMEAWAQATMLSNVHSTVAASLTAETTMTVATLTAAQSQINTMTSQLDASASSVAVQMALVGSTVTAASTNVDAAVSETSRNVAALATNSDQQLAALSRGTASQINAARSMLDRNAATRMSTLQASITSQTQPFAQLATALSMSHYMSPSTPFFRWHMFHVYSNNGVGWFDGNNVRFFGGLNPSRWGDGNPVVWQMHADIRYVAKLFTRRGVGTVSGATVCSETWYLYSSTDTKYCVAMFRIKNTRASAINMRWNWQGTGWSGWGNYQSVTANGNINWASDCTWWCDRTFDTALPPMRVSTVIFANGMTHPNHYSDNHHIETTFLGFNGLQLPAGLEYCDDMDTATGRWR
jgi:hypothetical protein